MSHWHPAERRWRAALVQTVIGHPTHLPSVETLDLSDFWDRFEQTAPLHVKLAFRTANLTLSSVLPRVMGHHHSLDKLTPEIQNQVIERALTVPPLSPLLDVAKIIACLAYFDGPEVQSRARRQS